MLPFAVGTGRLPNPDLVAIEGNKVVYKKTLAGEDVVTFPITGSAIPLPITRFTLKTGGEGRDEHAGDKPLKSLSLWSIRSNVSVEPFVEVSVAAGKSFDGRVPTATTRFRRTLSV